MNDLVLQMFSICTGGNWNQSHAGLAQSHAKRSDLKCLPCGS